MKNLLISCLLLALFTVNVHAQYIPNNIFHPFTGTMVFSVEGGPTAALTDYKNIRYDYNGRASLEYFFPFYSKSVFGLRALGGAGFIKGHDTKFTPADFRTDLTYFGGGVVYGISIAEAVFPYVFTGATYLRFNPKQPNGQLMPNNLAATYQKTELDYNAELGFRIALTDNLTINLASCLHISPRSYLDDVQSSNSNDMFVTGQIGFSIAFFGKKDSDKDGVPDDIDQCPDTPIGVKVDEHGCPIDSDHDGVPDYLDKCPDTPPGVKVDYHGCPVDSDHDGIPDYMDMCPNTPPGVPVDEFGCPKDSDGDGVPDYMDKCPNTPKGVQVDKDGCPLDSDGDGVPDYLDKCPNTPKGIQVDSTGCPIEKEKEQVIKEVPVIKEVQVEKQMVLGAGASFNPGKSVLLPGAFAELDKIVKVMKDAPKSKWNIEGHTDNKGSYEGNKKLSLLRAQAVLKYFVSKGIKKERFTVRGLGPDFPIANNNTEEGRQKNRRVAIIRVN